MAKQLIAIDETALDALKAELSEIRQLLNAANITARSERLTIRDYAEEKGVSTKTVNNWIAAGRVQVRGSGRLREVRR